MKLLAKTVVTFGLRHNKAANITSRIRAMTLLKIGTLSAIINDIAKHFEISREELINKLF